jgi:hypothetical protein
MTISSTYLFEELHPMGVFDIVMEKPAEVR